MPHTYTSAQAILTDCTHVGQQDAKVKIPGAPDLMVCTACWNAHVFAWREAKAATQKPRRPRRTYAGHHPLAGLFAS
jgi:hypothetical protein